jgi:hypothetical protein
MLVAALLRFFFEVVKKSWKTVPPTQRGKGPKMLQVNMTATSHQKVVLQETGKR